MSHSHTMQKVPTFKTLGRLLKNVFKYTKWRPAVVIFCILFVTIAGSSSTIWIGYMTNNVLIVGSSVNGVLITWKDVAPAFLHMMIAMLIVYGVGLIASAIQNYLMAIVVQSFLLKTRQNLFYRMESLPLRYFDTNNHGDIMSTYTNDIDATRQLIGIALPQLLQATLFCVFAFVLMLMYSIWLWLIAMLGFAIMLASLAILGGKSGKNFVKQQHALAKVEGFIEEMMGGQRVIKVFCHEEQAKKDFDKINAEYNQASSTANSYANSLMPVIMNIGNLMYVVAAVVGAVLVALSAKNIALGNYVGLGSALKLDPNGFMTIAVVVVFINLSRQFSINVGQIAMQTNAVVVGIAGASRVFALMDEQPETDNGYIRLVLAQKDNNGNLQEVKNMGNVWAWKDARANILTELKGVVQFKEVNFGYNANKTVLHDINLIAKEGQKIAFVGATGAGKTTITNLINRFYDIQSGEICYDGIDIRKIKKEDLRRSLGIVLQDTNLFTGTILENIRYGKLNATDEECIEAAKLANAHDFISRLPDGYHTVLKHEASNLSQGQRQLISIARVAVANPPVMILDEATSSIDTKTEALVQKGMDSLMRGRTVFVIAHRLSTIQNADCIMVLDKGRIIERGNHEKLLRERGIYYQLCTGALEIE